MAVLLKSLVHTHADAKAVFKDPTGSASPPAGLCRNSIFFNIILNTNVVSVFIYY